MATTTPPVLYRLGVLPDSMCDEETIQQVYELYLSALRDSDKATEPDDGELYAGMMAAYALVLRGFDFGLRFEATDTVVRVSSYDEGFADGIMAVNDL